MLQHFPEDDLALPAASEIQLDQPEEIVGDDVVAARQPEDNSGDDVDDVGEDVCSAEGEGGVGKDVGMPTPMNMRMVQVLIPRFRDRPFLQGAARL